MIKIIKNEFLRNFTSYLIVSGVFILLLIVSLSTAPYSHSYVDVNDVSHTLYYDNTYLYGIYVALMALCLIFVNFSYNKNKISIDLYYGLPVSKTKLFISKYVIFVLEFVITSIVMSLISLLIFVTKVNGINFGISYLYFLTCILFTISCSSYLIACYYYANNIIDGIMYMIFGGAIFTLLYGLIVRLVELYSIDIYLGSEIMTILSTCPYILPFEIHTYFNMTTMIEYQNNTIMLFNFNYSIGIVNFIVLFANFIPLIGIIAFAKYDLGERSQQVDNRYLGYKTLIPYIIFVGISWLMPTPNIMFSVAVVLLTYILYAVYRKSLKIKISDVVVILLLGIYSFAANALLYHPAIREQSIDNETMMMLTMLFN